MSVANFTPDVVFTGTPVASAPASRAWQRDLRLDFFRGLALLLIFVDHVSGNRFAALTLQSIGFADAAEVFVFIAGMASVYAYRKKFLTEGFVAGSLAVFARIRTLYLVHLMMLTGFVLLAALSLTGVTAYDLVQKLGLKPLLETPLEAAMLAPFLGYLPNYLDILPLYVMLLATVPLILMAGRVHVLLPLALAGSSYAVAQTTGINMPNYGNGFGWFLNPFAWLLLFVAGATVAQMRIGGLWQALPRPIIALITLFAAGFTMLAFLHAAPWRIVTAWEHISMLTFDFTPDKTLLTWHRLLDVLSKAWLAAVLVPMAAAGFSQGFGGAISRIGRHSLPVFVAGTFLSVFGSIIVHAADHHVMADVVVTFGGIAMLLGMGWVLENRRVVVASRSISAVQQQALTSGHAR